MSFVCNNRDTGVAVVSSYTLGSVCERALCVMWWLWYLHLTPGGSSHNSDSQTVISVLQWVE